MVRVIFGSYWNIRDKEEILNRGSYQESDLLEGSRSG